MTEAVRQGAATYPAGLDFAIFAYVRKGEQVEARMFAPLDNVPEDPATGSASAALGAFLTTLGSALPERHLLIEQGVEAGNQRHGTFSSTGRTGRHGTPQVLSVLKRGVFRRKIRYDLHGCFS